MTDSHNDAKRYALRLLGYRGRSEAELRERLTGRGFSEDEVSRTLVYLKETGFVDDGALALNLKRQALDQKRLGCAAARSFMLKKGIPRDIVEEILVYDEDVELRNARGLLDKKLKSVENYLAKKEKKRVYDYLARKGFSSSVINRALKIYGVYDEEEDEQGGRKSRGGIRRPGRQVRDEGRA